MFLAGSTPEHKSRITDKNNQIKLDLWQGNTNCISTNKEHETPQS